MSTLGNTATPLSGFDNPGSGYAFASSFTTPAGGGIVIQTLHAYFDSASGASTGYCCVWNNAGTLLANVNIGALNVKTGGVGNALDWWSGNLGTALYVAGSTAIWIGGYATGSLLFNSESGSAGASSIKSIGSGGPGSFASPTATSIGPVGAYVDYVPAGGYARRTSAWVAGPVAANRAGVKTIGIVQVRRGSGWVVGS
jgi:hypothetical protein